MYFISFQHETVTFLILPVTARSSPFLKQLYLLIKEPPRTTNWINYSVIHIMVKQANDLCHFFSLVKILWPFLFTAERRVFVKAPLSEARSQVLQPYSWEYLTVDLLTNVHTMNYRLIFVGWSECLHIDSRKGSRVWHQDQASQTSRMKIHFLSHPVIGQTCYVSET